MCPTVSSPFGRSSAAVIQSGKPPVPRRLPGGTSLPSHRNENFLVKRRTRSALAISLVGTVLAGLSACSASPGASSDDVTLTYWATNNGASVESDQALLQTEADKFTAETGVKVEVEVVPWATLLDRILTAVTTGEGPDVLNIGNTWTASLQATGAFLPFDDAVFDELGGADRYSATALEANGAVGETPISVPLYTFVNALYYNKALLAEAGIAEPPATWDELVTASKAITGDTDGDGATDRWGVSSEFYNSLNVWAYANQLDGSVLSEETPDLTNPAIASAIKEVADWIAVDKIVDPADVQFTSYTQVVQKFVDSDAAFILQQTGEQTFTNLGFSSDDYGVTALPVFDPLPADGEAVTAAIGGTNVAVFGATEHKAESVDFVRFLSSAEESVILNTAFGATSPVLEAQDDEAFQTPIALALADILNTGAKAQPQIASSTQLETALNGAITELWAQAATSGPVSDADISDALAAAQETYEATR